ncbi:EscU/YscU/HrcU family type III secretion system export apparatus switch protein [Gulosibacter molinativorax]|nr:EscU/YscU/HrcU family type III secretion system export apparatus switch protein [Gulosibacter molinativorax]QUY62165.1 Hypotetical protein [Gulosibacter molinativorax]
MSHTGGDFDSEKTAKFDWTQASGGEAPTDELELPQQNDRTRAMPVTSSEQDQDHGSRSGRTSSGGYAYGAGSYSSSSADDTKTRAFTPTPGYEQTVSSSDEPTRAYPVAEHPAADQPAGDRPSRDKASRQQEAPTTQYQQPAYQQQPQQSAHRKPTYEPLPVYQEQPAYVQKSPSAGARLGSLILNLVFAVGIVVLLWDYSVSARGESVVYSWVATIVDLPLLLRVNVVPIVIGVLALIAGLTLSLSGLGMTIMGLLLFLFSMAGATIPWFSNLNAMGNFLSFALPVLFPLSLLMIGAGIGAHFARGAGARKALRASSRGM